jgi:chromosome segregation ATPase
MPHIEMATRTAQEAHDALLALKPEGASHAPCSFCRAVDPEIAKEGEAVMPDERTYTANEHAAVLDAEVKRQTATLNADRDKLETEKSALQDQINGLESEKADLLSRIDKVEAEKSAAEKATEELQKEFDGHKAEVARKEEIAKLRAERAEKAKTELAGLDEKYFTDERIQRWAEMSAEAFEAAIADLKETAGAVKKDKKDGKEKPAFMTDDDEDDAKKSEKAARETAAFRGAGDGPSDTSGGQTTFMRLLAANR